MLKSFDFEAALQAELDQHPQQCSEPILRTEPLQKLSSQRLVHLNEKRLATERVALNHNSSRITKFESLMK